MTTRRITFTVRPDAHKRFTCHRCRRKLLIGERATIRIDGQQAVTTHAGRTCPPAFQTRSYP